MRLLVLLAVLVMMTAGESCDICMKVVGRMHKKDPYLCAGVGEEEQEECVGVLSGLFASLDKAVSWKEGGCFNEGEREQPCPSLAVCGWFTDGKEGSEPFCSPSETFTQTEES